MAKTTAYFRDTADSVLAQFKSSQCLSTISVGQATHEGELFETTVELINASFGSCVLLVDDTLQRHTMALNSTHDSEFYHKIAEREGDLWLERNRKYYERLSIPTKIMRWEHWLNHPEFQIKRKEILALLENDLIYKSMFTESIEPYLKKYRERLTNPKQFEMERARQLSLDFVVEECTALSLWPELNCHYEAYPNRHNKAIEETRRRFVLSSYPNLLQAVTIGFRNAKQLKPQQFTLNEIDQNVMESVTC